MRKKIFSLLLLAVVVQGKEISMFDAGDIESASPYGLTKSEKVVLKNTNKIKSLSNKINSLEQKNDALSQKIEGFASVYEGDSKKLNTAKKNLEDLNNQLEVKSNESLTNAQRIEALETQLNSFITLQEKNNDSLYKSLNKVTRLLNTINKNYVSKTQFNELVQYINSENKSTKKVEIKKNKTSTIKTPKVVKSNKTMMKEAIAYFKREYITKSMPMFEHLIKENYHPAKNSFYLAEVYFYKKRYKDAIHYYKKSMILNDQADYIPALLLHSAISFEKTKDKDNAINFYNTLVDAYPGTKESKEAAKKLKKLN